ncbi:hypothetical protein LTR37_012426 [Vermiconidia calcicola]|uniref:Uncharacterized protein n=1 Tax=Vermiconidia calcicola TaxID=1690605 RepID=A0ACC3MZJ6_9PEZI|nr:hypothetical protein LTR37_012426 [Vermiconidia calcicola]
MAGRDTNANMAVGNSATSRSDRLQQKRNGEQLQAARPGAKQDSMLFKIPAELRNRIYELALVHDDHIYIDRPMNKGPRGYDKVSGSYPPHLLSTSRQVHNEATQIYYGGNAFFSPSLDATLTWISAIGQERWNMVREIRGSSLVMHVVGALGKIDSVEEGIAARGVPLRDDTFHVRSSPVDGRQVFLNRTEVMARMTDDNWTAYHDRKRMYAERGAGYGPHLGR